MGLFVRRASAATGGFSLTTENAGAVAGIGARPDGLPPAIELAAGRVTVLSAQRLPSRLERSFEHTHVGVSRSVGLRGSLAPRGPRPAILSSPAPCRPVIEGYRLGG